METEINRTKWIVDPAHSELSFKVKHLMITNVKGEFREFEANVYTDGKELMTSDIELTINPASITTGDAQRDGHLKSADFFDVENHSQIVFKGNSFEKVSDGTYVLHGDLEMRGVRKPVKLDVEFGGVMKDPWGNEKAGFTVNGKISRKEWGLNWNAALETGGVLVSDEVKINGDVQLVRASN
ncbi:MAG TPA: YceI family protein [Bacteroidales bacterium]|jgi:polyisoprenoid-binding protein YceI|nr:YceI family protein [Bacteroidales bacterium]